MNTIRRFSTCIVLGIFMFAGCDKAPKENKESAEKAQEKAPEVIKLTEDQIRSAKIETVKASLKSLQVEIEALGEVASDTDRLTQVRPDSNGSIREIKVAVGDAVEAGQVLLRYAGENGSDIRELKAERPGVVVGLYAEPEGHIDPAVPLVTIADTSKLRVGLNVYEKDIGRIQKGQHVKIKIAAYPDTTFEGVATYISPRVDEESRTVKVRADVVNTGGKLKFGMFITGRVAVGSRETLLVPETALQNIKGKNVLFITPDGKTFMPREIEIGERSAGQLEIKKGLQAGETVVTQGSFILKSELSKSELGEGE